jgi:hypothetical protein
MAESEELIKLREESRREIIAAFQLEIASQLKGYSDSQQCRVSCEKVQEVSEHIAVLVPRVDLAIEGVSNFRKHAIRANTYFDKAEAVLEADEKRRKNSRWYWSGAGAIFLVLLSIFCIKVWDTAWALIDLAKRAPEIHKLTDDWVRYYSTRPDDWMRYYNQAPENPAVPAVPVKPHKSYFAQPNGGISPSRMNAGNELRNP